MNITPLTLTGAHISLVPLAMSHISALDNACMDASDSRRSIWRYLLDARTYREQGMQGLVSALLTRQTDGTDLPFAIIENKSGHAIGTTRYMEIDIDNRVVEIGTWIGLPYQREGFNLESKYLLLKHAFERLNVVRVQFKIDQRNFASIDAIEKIRAHREGVLRNHIILADGTPRSSVYFSMLNSEWPAVEVHLEHLMARTS